MVESSVFLSMRRDFEDTGFSYEEWKSVLHLSTRWGFAAIRKLALSSIVSPTRHDLILLARTDSVDHWVVPALSELCKRIAPLTLSEARQMDIEDVVLVVTVRETIRSRSFQVKAAEISRHIVAAQAGILAGCEGLAVLLSIPQRGTSVSAPSPIRNKVQRTKMPVNEVANIR